MDTAGLAIDLIENSQFTQREISLRAGKRPTWVGDLLQGWRGCKRRGHEPTLPVLRALARGLDVSLHDLLKAELESEGRGRRQF